MSETTIYKCNLCGNGAPYKNRIILQTTTRYSLYDDMEFDVIDVCPVCLALVKRFIDKMELMR